MKRLFILLLITLCITNLSLAQDKLYLLFEFMRVDNEQESSYAETEAFWAKIHQQRVNNDDIIGWDLWRLQPGGEDQHYQYMTVNLYNDPTEMMSGESWEDLMTRARAAYPGMSEADITTKIYQSSKTRDLAVRVYLEQIAATDGDFDMPLGTVASIDLMKVDLGNYGVYEKAESEVFKPLHQKQVDSGNKGSWGLLRIISPIGSDTYASHITVNMFKNYQDYLAGRGMGNGPEPTAEQQKAIEAAVASRDMKYVYTAELIKRVRK
jgi:hypothetical protein